MKLVSLLQNGILLAEIGFGFTRYLNEPEVPRAVQMLEDGAIQRSVAERLGASRSVVARLWIPFKETRRPGQGL